MDEDLLADLKQFIAATVSQQLAEQTELLREEIAGVSQEVKSVEYKLTVHMQDLSEAIAGAFDDMSEAYDKRFHEHEQRIIALETA